MKPQEYNVFFIGDKPSPMLLRLRKGDIILFCPICKGATWHVKKREYGRGYSPKTITTYVCEDCNHNTGMHAGKSKFTKLSLMTEQHRFGLNRI